MARRLIVAALSSRAYVEMAVLAGYEVIAIDAFADRDTRKCALQCWQIPLTDKGLDGERLLACLDEIALGNIDGFCYGAGFEQQPELLEAVSARVNLLGNTPETVRLSKSPMHFSAFCERLEMQHPKVQFEAPVDLSGWLYKTTGGSGGVHIRKNEVVQDVRGYYQQACTGVPISCLFAVVNGTVKIIGFNEQWCSPTNEQPYRLGGVVSKTALPQAIQARIVAFINGLAHVLSLRGINSVDFLWAGDTLHALELNPRLSASLDLYRAESGCLCDWHIDEANECTLDSISRAFNVVYANRPVQIVENWTWPEWVKDMPMSGSRIAAGMPLCSVHAAEDTAAKAKQQVLARSQAIIDLIDDCE